MRKYGVCSKLNLKNRVELVGRPLAREEPRLQPITVFILAAESRCATSKRAMTFDTLLAAGR